MHVHGILITFKMFPNFALKTCLCNLISLNHFHFFARVKAWDNDFTRDENQSLISIIFFEKEEYAKDKKIRIFNLNFTQPRGIYIIFYFRIQSIYYFLLTPSLCLAKQKALSSFLLNC